MFQKKQKPFLLIVSFLLLFTCFSLAFALETTGLPEAGGITPGETTDLPQYINYLFNFAIIIAGIVAFGVIVWSGIKILISPDQPNTINDARSKIVGALLGIVILLSSYLILTTINPQLRFIGLEKIEPVTGVYLTDEKGKDHYVADSSSDVGFTANAVKFISPPEELIAVYDSNDNRTDNPGGAFSGKSIFFLWNKPGIYLYPKTNSLGRPKYFNTSVSGLSNYNFDNPKSLEFVRVPGLTYAAVFFTESDYRGACGFDTADVKIADIETGAGAVTYTHPIGANGLSSLIIFNFSKISAGSVTFYDGPNCGGLHSYQVDIDSGSFIKNSKLSLAEYGDKLPLKDHIISFKIDGSFDVLITTKEDFNGRCQLFSKPSGSNCYPSIESSYLWDPSWILGPSVGSYAIIPREE